MIHFKILSIWHSNKGYYTEHRNPWTIHTPYKENNKQMSAPSSWTNKPQIIDVRDREVISHNKLLGLLSLPIFFLTLELTTFWGVAVNHNELKTEEIVDNVLSCLWLTAWQGSPWSECWMEGACFEQREWGKRAQWTKTATQEVRGREKSREPRGTWATEAHTSTSGSLAGPEEELAECFSLAVALVPLSKVIVRKGLRKGDKRGRWAKVKEHWQTRLLLLTNVISTPLCLNSPVTTQAPDCADILHAHREADPGLFQAKALSKFLITTNFLRVTNTGFSRKA